MHVHLVSEQALPFGTSAYDGDDQPMKDEDQVIVEVPLPPLSSREEKPLKVNPLSFEQLLLIKMKESDIPNVSAIMKENPKDQSEIGILD